MATAAFPLQALPAELQCSIIRQLDPIALISLSQTNKHFRETVSPRRIHFIERLLALECDETIGGPPIHFSRFGTLNPDRLSPEWEANRWACSSCMRLLPQHHFANQALSRLAYRKPVPGSPAADAVTSWEPTWMSSLTRRRRKANRKDRTKKKAGGDCGAPGEEAKMRQRYGVAMSQAWGWRRGPTFETISLDSHLTERFEEFREMGFEEFHDMTHDEFQSIDDEQEWEILDRERQAIELVRAGWKRHLRRCLECRFQRGELRGTCGRRNGNIGTAKVPIVRARVKYYGLEVDRYFPGVSEVLDSKRPDVNAPSFVVYREDALDMPWTQYRVRCPGCAQWKEMRAFRFGGRWPRWQPMEIDSDTGPGYDGYPNWDSTPVTEELMNNISCNHCFAKANGREALGKQLVAWLGALIEMGKEAQTGNLVCSFRTLHWYYTTAPKTHKARIKELVWDLVPLFDKATAEFTRQDVSLLSHRYTQLRPQPDLFLGRLGNELWTMERYERFHDSEAIWSWLQTLSVEIEDPGKAEALADWVLSRDESVAC